VKLWFELKGKLGPSWSAVKPPNASTTLSDYLSFDDNRSFSDSWKKKEIYNHKKASYFSGNYKIAEMRRVVNEPKTWGKDK